MLNGKPITHNDVPEVLEYLLSQNSEIMNILNNKDRGKKMLVPEAAAYLGYETEQALYQRLGKKNPPPSYRPGKAYHFYQNELDEWIKKFPPKKRLTKAEKADKQLQK